MSLPAASRPSKLLLRRLLNPRNHSTLSSSFDLLATEKRPFHQPKEDPPSPPSSAVTEILGLVDDNEYESWKSDVKLNQLLFSNSSGLSSHHILQLTRQLGCFDTALKFMDYYQSNSTSSGTDFISYGYQGVFELASREYDSEEKILELLGDDTGLLRVPLNVNSAAFLIRFFGKAKMVHKSKFVYNAVPSLRDVCVRNALLEVLFEFEDFHDALNVLDEMLEKGSEFPPDGKTRDTVFPAMLKIGRKLGDEKIVELVSKFGDHDVFPDVITLTKWITKLYKFGKGDVAWDLLHTVMDFEGAVEAPSCNATLAGLARAGHFTKMNLLLKEMKEKNIMPNVVTFGILVNYLCKSGRVDEAIEVSEKMNGGGVDAVPIKPDVVIYNTLIDGLCKIGRQDQGLKLMEKMRSDDLCAPTAATYNCLIDGFCKAGEIEKSYGLFETMEKEGVPPNIVTVNTMIDGLARLGKVGNASDLFSKMKDKGLKGNAVTYSILIRAFCSLNNLTKAMDLFDEMAKTCEPDAKLYYILIAGLSQAGHMDDAARVASMMKEAGFRPDIGCYNVMLSGFCKKRKTDKIYETLKEMEAAEFCPDGITYNTLISYFSKTGDFETAHRILTKMVDEGCVPTVVTYGALIHGLCVIGDLEEAMNIFRAMSVTSRVPPNTVIYNTLIDSLCKKKRIEDALFLLDDMKVKGVRPATNTFNPIFEVLMEMNWLDKAFELMDQMTEYACIPDAVTMDFLTKWLPGVGATDKLKSFIEGYRVCTLI